MKFPVAVTRWHAVGITLVLFLVTMAYFPGLQGPFVFDDNSNIIHSPATALTELRFDKLRDAFFPLDGVRTTRGLAHLSFALNYYFSGAEFNAWNFKITNLLIHLLNTLLLWFIAHQLLRRFAFMHSLGETLGNRPWWHWAALLSALMWGLHPLQLTAVLYVVQRMTSLSAFFCLLGLAVWIHGRARLETGRKWGLTWMTLGLVLGAGLGILSKENAILLPYYMLLTEWGFFTRHTLAPKKRMLLRGFFLLFAFVPAVLAGIVLFNLWDSYMVTYQGRNFTLAQRLLTEPRILWYYLQLLLYPNTHNFGIYHDDFTLSTGLFSPLTTVFALSAWAGVVIVAVRGLARRRLFAFAMLWYLVGHSIESSFLGLELIFEHRNYLPVTAVTMVLAVYLVRGLSRLTDKAVLQFGIPAVFLLLLFGATFTRANIWQDKYVLMNAGVNNHPDSPRYHMDYAVVLANAGADDKEVFRHLQSAVRLHSGTVTSLFGMSEVINRRLYKLIGTKVRSTTSKRKVDVLNDPLPDDVTSLETYDSAINLELLHRARTAILITTASEMSRYIRSCLYKDNPVCKRMQDKATLWIRALLENPRQFPEIRAQSELAYAKIIAKSDPAVALEAVNNAIHLTPETLKYRVEKVTLLMALGQLDAAARALNEAERTLHWSGRGRSVIDLLRKQINAAGGHFNAPVDPTHPLGKSVEPQL